MLKLSPVELPRVTDYPITRPENVTTRSYPIPDFSIFQLPDTRKLIFGYPRVEDRVFLLNKKHSLLSKTTIVVLIVMPSRTGLFIYYSIYRYIVTLPIFWLYNIDQNFTFAKKIWIYLISLVASGTRKPENNYPIPEEVFSGTTRS